MSRELRRQIIIWLGPFSIAVMFWQDIWGGPDSFSFTLPIQLTAVVIQLVLAWSLRKTAFNNRPSGQEER